MRTGYCIESNEDPGVPGISQVLAEGLRVVLADV